MIRRILGYALLAFLALLALRLAFSLLGSLIGLMISVAVLVAMGYAGWLLLKVISPEVAGRVRDRVRGAHPAPPAAAPPR